MALIQSSISCSIYGIRDLLLWNTINSVLKSVRISREAANFIIIIIIILLFSSCKRVESAVLTEVLSFYNVDSFCDCFFSESTLAFVFERIVLTSCVVSSWTFCICSSFLWSFST